MFEEQLEQRKLEICWRKITGGAGGAGRGGK